MRYAVTNYDVLLSRDASGHCTVAVGEDLGNKRLQILLDIHREGYNLARLGADTTQCERIVDKIINTVCVECVPNGRFLERIVPSAAGTVPNVSEWRELFPPEIKVAIQVSLGGAPLFAPLPHHQPPLQPNPAVLENALHNAVMIAEIGRRRAALQRSLSEGPMSFPPPLSNGGTTGLRRAHSIQSEYAPIQPDPNTLSPNPIISAMPVTDRQASAPEASGRWTSNVMNNNKAPPPPSSLPPVPDTSLDIIFSQDGESISSSAHAGNNRFRILVDLQTKSFLQAGNNTLGQDRILEEIMESVNSWSGQFLIESVHQYQYMSTEQVKTCLRKVLDISGLRSTEIDVLKARRERKESMRMMTEKMASKSDSNLNYSPDDDLLMDM